jgi:hypothetical protein
MADGDRYDLHGRKWWKTASRKLFAGDQTFNGSAVWSIDKIFRDGNLTAFCEVVRLLGDAIDLRGVRIDSQMLVDVRLREIAQAHPDHDSGTAVGIARGLSVDAEFVSRALQLPKCERNEFIGQQILSRVAVENCSTPELVAELSSASGRERLAPTQIVRQKERAISVLGQSEDVRQRVRQQLTGWQESPLKPVSLSRPRATVDQRTLISDATAFGE